MFFLYHKIQIYKMIYEITEQITNFDQIDWINVQNIIGGNVTHLYCDYNQITSFQHLPNTVTHLHCRNNQITSFQYMVNSVTKLFCENN